MDGGGSRTEVRLLWGQARSGEGQLEDEFGAGPEVLLMDRAEREQAQGGLVSKRHSANVPEEEKRQGKEDSAGFSLSTWRTQGPRTVQPGWGQSYASEQGHVPPHPHSRAVQSSRQPCFLWMWSPALVNPMGQWLSGNQVCTPGLADKGRVLVSQ